MRAQIGRFRELAIAAKTGDPFFVLSGSPKEIAELAPKLGGDAVGSYVITSGQGSGGCHALVRVAERGWRTLSEAGLPVVPRSVMTGWDRRPRVENPVPWEQQQTWQGMEYYFDAPQPAELASHLQDAIDWVRSQPVDRRSPVALVYAWNENDEGGWLVPTIPCDMRNSKHCIRYWDRGCQFLSQVARLHRKMMRRRVQLRPAALWSAPKSNTFPSVRCELRGRRPE